MTFGSNTKMEDGNRHASPNSETGNPAVGRPPRPLYAWTLILLFVGGCFLLLLNGQVFTNTLVFIGFTATSAMMWMRYALRSRKESSGRLGMYVLLAHVIVLFVCVLGLPEKHHWQQEFNKRMNDALERARPPAD